jgi:hypothetical protein
VCDKKQNGYRAGPDLLEFRRRDLKDLLHITNHLGDVTNFIDEDHVARSNKLLEV